MTDRSTKISLALLLVAVSLFIFFTPFVLGRKQPAIEASVKQNMEFLDEIAKKYKERKGNYATDAETLLKDARDNRYNKTLFNPLNLVSGDLNNPKIIEFYSPTIAMGLNAQFTDRSYAGKTGYISDGTRYRIYGHLQDGQLMTENGQILSFGNY